MRALKNAICGKCRMQLIIDAPCPSCGSNVRCFLQSVGVEVTTKTSSKIRQKRPGVGGWLIEMIVGQEPRKGPGGVFVEWVNKYWRKDKPADRYIEHIATEDGEILRDVDEPLSGHFGHGSDRADLKAARQAEIGLKAKGKI